MLASEQRMTYEEFLEVDKNKDDSLEFIDGEICLQAAPSVAHQTIVTNLSAEFRDYFKKNKGKCVHFVAPFDVVLSDDKEDKNRVQPDLTVICDKDGLGENNYKGTPTLVVEVLSPSTASVDYIKKMNLYMRFGVKEYWIISPKENFVQIFYLNENGQYKEPKIYLKNDVVKSEVFGDLEINLSDVFEF